MSMIRSEKSKKKNGKNERGATLVEYALLVGLVAIASVVALQGLQGDIANSFTRVGDQLDAAVPAAGN
jgi:pilus assembly protein Flp/PilA